MPHDITISFTYYLHILHNLKAMKLTFLKLVLICMFHKPNWAKKKDFFFGKSFKKLNSAKFMEFVFFQVCGGVFGVVNM